jgi:hypothetical protein
MLPTSTVVRVGITATTQEAVCTRFGFPMPHLPVSWAKGFGLTLRAFGKLRDQTFTAAYFFVDGFRWSLCCVC